jgi:phage shock protein A
MLFTSDFAEAVEQLRVRVTELEGQIQAKEQERRQAVEARHSPQKLFP